MALGERLALVDDVRDDDLPTWYDDIDALRSGEGSPSRILFAADARTSGEHCSIICRIQAGPSLMIGARFDAGGTIWPGMRRGFG